MRMPKNWHYMGEPVSWTGETWFQLARPKLFRCPKTNKQCTWVLGRKTELKSGTKRPMDVLPEVWSDMMTAPQRKLATRRSNEV